MAQGALHETGGHAGFEQMGGVGMPEGMKSHPCFGDAGSLCGGAEGALDTRATHGGDRRRTLGVIPPSGGKEPRRVPMGFPGGAEESEGICGEGDVAVFGALAMMDMDLEALAINVRTLKRESFMEPESQALDGGEGDLVVQGSGGGEEPSNFLHTEDGRQTV